MPLVSWIAPGNRGDGLFLWPSIRYCHQQLEWLPDLVVGDMAYINLQSQRRIRELGVTMITKIRADMYLTARFEPGPVAVCPQGQRLEWLGYEHRDQLHCFGVMDPEPLCWSCWEQSKCAHQFFHAPSEHEILFGSIPLSSKTAQTLLTDMRPGIEPAQSFEKNQLGLSQMFFNSLRLTWTMGLLADAVVLLRARAVLESPPKTSPMYELTAQQLPLDLGTDEK